MSEQWAAWFPGPALPLRERVAAGLGRLGPDGVTVRRVVEALGEEGLSRARARGDWWAPVVLAEVAAELLTPVQAAAVAAHFEIAVPALAAAPEHDARGGDPVAEGIRVVGYPLGRGEVAVRRVASGVRLTGTYKGFAAAGELHSFLLPVPRSTATQRVAVVNATSVGVRVVAPTGVVLSKVFVQHCCLLPVDREYLASARLWLAAYEVAAARQLLEQTRRHTNVRRSFGQPLWEHQAVQLRIADLVAQADGTRRLVHHAARSLSEATATPELIAAAEVNASRLLRETAVHCQHLYGAAGYLAGQRSQQLLLEARVLSATRQVDQTARAAIAAARGWADE
ncbi:MAG: acyl-CoA dehydrogenase family protein [Actinomadura sp.]